MESLVKGLHLCINLFLNKYDYIKPCIGGSSMPYLFRSSDSFIIVDERPKQGIFYQYYNKDGFSRPLFIHNGPSLDYSVTLDSSHNLHVVVEAMNRQIIYYDLSTTTSRRRVILEDTRTTYLFENLSIHWLENEAHIFYTVLHPNGLNRSLVHQALTEGTPKVENLLTSLPLRTSLTYYVSGSTLYILYPNYEESYCLNMLTFTPSSRQVTTLVRSSIPIIEWNICKHENTLYVLYKADQYGHATYHLINLTAGTDLTIPLPDMVSGPVLLSFLNNLWIHYEASGKYYTLLALPESQTFSTPVLSSLQNHVGNYTYYCANENYFEASSVYASLSNTLRLLTIAELDIRGIHPDLTNKDELALFIEGMHLQQTQVPQPPLSSPAPPKAPMPYLPPSAPSSPLSRDSSSPLSSSPYKKDLKSLTEAFMNTGNTFEP